MSIYESSTKIQVNPEKDFKAPYPIALRLCSLVRQIMKERRTTGASELVVSRSLIESDILAKY